MTREAFKQVLDEKQYPYEIEGNRVVVTHGGYTNLGGLTSLPSGVEFRNGGSVNLESLISLPSGVVFKNVGGEHGFLDSLTSIPSGAVFENWGDVYLESLIGGYFDDWEGNIEGIDSKRLLNKMISLGLFEKRR